MVVGFTTTYAISTYRL